MDARPLADRARTPAAAGPARVGAALAGWVVAAVALTACGESRPPTVPDNTAALATFLAGPRGPEPRIATFAGAGGDELGFQAYLADEARTGVALVYLHGLESHAGWFEEPARRLRGRGYDLFALDRRGSGINREDRGLPSGHATSSAELLADLDAFLQPLAERYPRIVLVGLSWGGKLATAYALERPGAVAGLVLITPGLAALVDFPPVTRLRILAASLVAPETRVPTPIEPAMFTTDPVHLAFIEQDPLRLRSATASFFMVSRDLDRLVERRLPSLTTPVQLFLAGGDRIIDNDAVRRLLERAHQAPLAVVEYPDQTHSIQFDAPARMVDDMVRWLDGLGLSTGTGEGA